MVIGSTTVTRTRKDHNRDRRARRSEERAESSVVSTSGTDLAISYIEQRAHDTEEQTRELGLVDGLLRRMQALESDLDSLRGAHKRAQELERTVESLRAYTAQLEETVHQLQIGFRRHTTERVSPDQLKLVLFGAAQADSPQPDASPTGGGDITAQAEPGDSAELQQPPSQPPANTAKKRDNHGRRRISVIPKVVIEVLPSEVLLGGLSNFERMGADDTAVLGYRRGGEVELVFRRPKYVARQPNSGKAASDATIPSATLDSDGTAVVLEHEALMVPEDTGFKRSPFVDGAIVRYTPEPAISASDVGQAAPVLIAPPPERPIDKGLADMSLIAHVLVHKQDYHVPYYRQEVEFERLGWPISRANMARWQYECGELAMRITDAMWHEALARSWFAMDATGTAIRAKDANRYGHVFVLVAPGDGVLFRFAPKYDSATVQKLFGGYKATIVADASANHNILFGPGKSREGGCWSHARKPWVKALRAGESKDAAFVLQTIQTLFRIEEQIALLSPEARLEVRQRDSAPLVKALYEWVDTRLPVVRDDQALVRKGLVYLDNQRVALQEFLSNGEIPIHNNSSELALRRIVKGRINWLFHGSDKHAERACAVSSLIASCAIHGLDPELYLQEVLTVAPTYPARDVLDLSPKNWVATRQRLIAQGRLKYIDLARLFGSNLAFRAS